MTLENWLKSAMRNKSLVGVIFEFLDFNQQSSGIENKLKANPDEVQIQEFVEKISKTSNNKMKLIETFNFQFFSKKRSIHQDVIGMLIECLIPLCGDGFLGSKALDILSKLTTSEYFRDFSIVCKELCKILPEILKKMNLNDYLTKKRFSDYQLQAYNLCKILEESLEKSVLEDIVIFIQLQNDIQAIRIYENWGIEAAPISPASISPNLQDWRPLIFEKDMSLQFKFIGKELEIHGELFAETNISRIIDMLTIPCERKKWDLRMVDMQLMPDMNTYILIYISDRTLYEFHTAIIQNQNHNTGMVEFKTICYEAQKKGSIKGNFSSIYCIELIEDHISSTKESEEKNYLHSCDERKSCGKVKVTWNSHFCEHSYALIRGDLFQEANVVKKSFETFISVAENRYENSTQYMNKHEKKQIYNKTVYISSP